MVAETILYELSLHEDLSLIKKRLKLGDYQLNDWLIERKTLPDLVQSLCDGRLFSQITRLAASPSHTALLLEGCTQDIAGYQIRRGTYRRAVLHFNQFPYPNTPQFIANGNGQNTVFLRHSVKP
ncbi:Hef nuclease [Shewanella putrefaciens]|nr:Hef nuclease [Shewanella putrefaciens]